MNEGCPLLYGISFSDKVAHYTFMLEFSLPF